MEDAFRGIEPGFGGGLIRHSAAGVDRPHWRGCLCLTGKRQWQTITAKFSQRDVDNIGESIAIKDTGDRIAHIQHEHAQSAMRLIRAGAFLVGALADAANRCQRSVDLPHHIADWNGL